MISVRRFVGAGGAALFHDGGVLGRYRAAGGRSRGAGAAAEAFLYSQKAVAGGRV